MAGTSDRLLPANSHYYGALECWVPSLLISCEYARLDGGENR